MPIHEPFQFLLVLLPILWFNHISRFVVDVEYWPVWPTVHYDYSFTSVKHSHFSIVTLGTMLRAPQNSLPNVSCNGEWPLIWPMRHICGGRKAKYMEIVVTTDIHTHTQQVVNCYARGTQIGFGPVFLLIMTSKYSKIYYIWMNGVDVLERRFSKLYAYIFILLFLLLFCGMLCGLNEIHTCNYG